ncbi:MAG: hypothetical protein HOL48_03040 [Porticoccaceae bacterium]|nr:hypothetical protein [Porticoccaceae bacterium]
MKLIFAKSFYTALLAASLLLLSQVATAHHSKALQFDMNSEIVVVGTIIELEWRNPHAWLNIEAENEHGENEIWRIEFSSANSLLRRGWRPADIPIGAEITVHGLPSRDGSRTVDGEQVTLPDGRSLMAGSREGY